MQNKKPKALAKARQAFTLVELIVVITILAILGTIAFISLQGYSSSARNSVRISDINTVEKGLELYSLKSGHYLFPEDFETFTGGTDGIIRQGILGEQILSNLKITNNVKDPLTEEKYTYSIFGEGKYYQITYELEDDSLSKTNLLNQTNALNGKIVKVDGNYEMDPSLPSLIVVPSSVTSSGIFDPNVCFIMDGGENKIDSEAGNCIKKKDLSLKDFDDGLVGYWDMETLSGTLLKDLSGNGNNGMFSGGMNAITSLSGGILGKGINFTNSGYYIEISDNNILDLEIFSVQTSFYYSGVYTSNIGPIFLSKGVYPNYNFKLAFYPEDYIGGKYSPKGNWYNIFHIYDGNDFFIYLNGELIRKAKIENFGIINNNPVIIGKYIVNTSYSFKGIIDDIKIYNKVLSDQEIKQQAKIAGF